VLIAEQPKIGAGDGNRTHLAGLGMLGVRKHICNRGNYLPKIELPPLTRRTHPIALPLDMTPEFSVALLGS